jgi:hypothetical protein
LADFIGQLRRTPVVGARCCSKIHLGVVRNVSLRQCHGSLRSSRVSGSAAAVGKSRGVCPSMPGRAPSCCNVPCSFHVRQRSSYVGKKPAEIVASCA